MKNDPLEQINSMLVAGADDRASLAKDRRRGGAGRQQWRRKEPTSWQLYKAGRDYNLIHPDAKAKKRKS